MNITVTREVTIVLSDADAKELHDWMARAWQALHKDASGLPPAGFHEPTVQAIYDAPLGAKP